jgi:hypothetical protein
MFGFLKRRSGPDVPPPLSPITVPPEVREFLGRRLDLNAASLQINVLDEQGCAEYSAALRATSVGACLGLVALDNAEYSNPYCLITKGVASGMVIHFSHDPEPRIAFSSLSAFASFLADLGRKGSPLWLAEPQPVAHSNQNELSKAIEELLDHPDADASEDLFCLYLPLLRGDHANLLSRVAKVDSFFVREAVACSIGRTGLLNCMGVLGELAQDSHPQVRNAAQSALGSLTGSASDGA